MDSEYDRKFAEMKSYIPFLERMIKRLEHTSTTSNNPRQAQLDKIRSLRDLLLDKKKRMKMENLKKCEQVLLNLYYKVEQKDILPGMQKTSEIVTPLQTVEKPTSREKLDLQAARNKLLKVQEAQPETLPEIARANEIEVNCSTGSKEPALFQRRPHISSKSPKPSPIKSPRSSSAKRSNTRLLESPDSRERRWTTENHENALFSRRSPRRSPRRYSPSYHKRERKKYTKDSKSHHRQDLNITLKVPEESLNSLNTEDILSRIINCNSNDVDINTLRELRNQILGELKHTGMEDDISDLLLKSYKHKKKVSKGKEEVEVEEGELSDSESEAIENIYGSVVIMENNKQKEDIDKSGSISLEKDKESRKIQICLVINSDKDNNSNSNADKTKNLKQAIENIPDTSDLQMYENKAYDNGAKEILTGKASVTESIIKDILEKTQYGKESTQPAEQINTKQNQIDTTPDKDVIVIEDFDEEDLNKNNLSESSVTGNEIVSDSDGKGPEYVQRIEVDKDIREIEQSITKETSELQQNITTTQQFLPNFYKPLSDQSNLALSSNVHSVEKNETKLNNKSDDTTLKPNKEVASDVQETMNITSKDNDDRTNKNQELIDIPFLNSESDIPVSPKKNDVVSEIDILQALKNDILSDTIAISDTITVTPPLHVPKITKVASAQEILPKKRISIEKYKEKVISSPRHTSTLFLKDVSLKENLFQKEDNSKKQSLKLTAKECVRFSFINKIALDDISDDDDNDESKIDDVNIYEFCDDLAPKSPDVNLPVAGITSPVIIPTDPVETVSKNAFTTDVDMRKLDNTSTSSVNKDAIGDVTNMENKSMSTNCSKDTIRLHDPRVRRDVKIPNNMESPKVYGTTAERSPVVTMSTLNTTPHVRSYEVTPHTSVEIDEHSASQVSGGPIFINHDSRESPMTGERRKSRWGIDDRDQNDSRKWENRDSRSIQSTGYTDINSIRNRMDVNNLRAECPPTPSHYFGMSECPPTPTPSFGRLEPPSALFNVFMRSECPLAPSHAFGQSEGSTVVSSFGISECPPTPSHSFGWSDSSRTSSHSFGMSDCPSTPSHPFGRYETPRTPNHPFGRTDYNQSHHKFGKSVGRPHDPRIHRHLEDDDRERFYKDGHNRLYNNSDLYRNYRRERDDSGKDCSWRESSVGRGMPKEHDNDRLYKRDRRRDYCYENERSVKDVGPKRGYQRECSPMRTNSESNRYRYRAASVGRALKENVVNDNTLFVEPHSGRSFTINTSINTTFQRDNGVNRCDLRRQRAASVGRCLLRDSSPERTQDKRNTPKNSNRQNHFQRARSVGREIVNSNKTEKSFNDIKADFKAFSSKFNEREEKRKFSFHETMGRISRKNVYDAHTISERNVTKYSPRKNNRDPRMRRDQRDNKYNKYRYDSHEKQKHCMVYSNDNIAKGAILGAGFGVKNYKIPKLKRISQETNEKTDDKNTENVDNTRKEKQQKSDMDDRKHKTTESIKGTRKEKDRTTDVDKQNKKSKSTKDRSDNLLKSDTVDSDSSVKSNSSKKDKNKSKCLNSKIKKYVTRSSKEKSILESENSDSDTNGTVKRNRKAVIRDSDSDDNEEVVTEPLLLDKSSSGVSESRNLGNNDEKVESFSCSYDLDMFSDSIAMDPVVNNIHTLIEHLEDDLDTPKVDTRKVNESSNFTQEFSLEKMLENISSSENCPLAGPIEVATGADNSVSSKQNINVKCDESSTNIADSSLQIKSKETYTATCTNIPVQSHKAHNENSFRQISQSIEPIDGAADVCNVDLRTEIEREPLKTSDVENCSENENIGKDTDLGSIPDSTINKTDEKLPDESIVEEKFLDNTQRDQSGMIDDVSSTHDSPSDNIANIRNTDSGSPHKVPVPQLEMESFLSILQNKSKIKELLFALGDQTNDKMKKKLEKLSEIVSDDEDTKLEDIIQVESTTKDTETVVEVNETNDVTDDEMCGQEAENVDESKEDDNTANVVENCVQEENEELDELKKNDKTEGSRTSTFNIQETDEEPHETGDNNEIKDDNNIDDGNENEIVSENVIIKPNKPARRMPPKKGKKVKGKMKKQIKNNEKRPMKSKSVSEPTTKRKNTELMKLQRDINEMFIRDGILNATGLRMCRLAKLDHYNKDASCLSDEETANKQDIKILSNEPSVANKALKKKAGPKPKPKTSLNDVSGDASKTPKNLPKHKPGLKSKSKRVQKSDPYDFDCDSDSEIIQTKMGYNTSSDSENDFTESSSDAPSEATVEVKSKPKRKRRGWKAGVIKARNKKKKVEAKRNEVKSPFLEDNIPISEIKIPDLNCFTDKYYCFLKNITLYSCRLCEYKDDNIVSHYKKDHPHCEIPLSRMEPEIAKEAIEQCEDPHFHIISKMVTDKYVCRFCFEEFSKRKDALEQFFWHIVRKHTGEYKQLCSECVNVSRCPFNLDIPPPPEANVRGQLIGFICGKCYFTQLSLENLKSHVIMRHNGEQIEVYTINLSIMSKKKMNELAMRAEKPPRVLRSSRSYQSLTEPCDSRTGITESNDYTTDAGSAQNQPDMRKRISTENVVHSKSNFETDDSTTEILKADNNVKIQVQLENVSTKRSESRADDLITTEDLNAISNDVNVCPHFKISYTKGYIKEYVCCINGNDNHYKTSLLISMKKHVQTKHSEKWDGYCYICKVIVTTQGTHNFRECFQHYLDKHIDNLLEVEPVDKQILETAPAPPSTSFVNVRPFSELSKQTEEKQVPSENLPVIESVVSLGFPGEDQIHETVSNTPEVITERKYEEAQEKVVHNKHSVVLQTMMTPDKLVHIFKCAGRYCSFTSDSAEKALLHASKHQIIGGVDSLNCAYCDFDSSGNAIDLVSHVFKEHSAWHYACGNCFYRAAFCQLVNAHSCSKHVGKPPAVLRSTSAPASADVDTSGTLKRDDAVPFYVCCQGKEEDKSCKFRTYVLKKFMEHFEQKHSTENEFTCYICSASMPSTMDLVMHMDSHNIQLYQCTYCVHGAYNEPTMLCHAAAKHPSKLPRAYIRMTTAKDGSGSTEYRVLPLARLNKADVDVQFVAPCITNENPTKEAERSIELEKLVNHTNPIKEAIASDVVPEITKKFDMNIPEIEDKKPNVDQFPGLNNLLIDEIETEAAKQASSNTILSSRVICLDSDEENFQEAIISEPSPTKPTSSILEPPSAVVQPSLIVHEPNPAVVDSSIVNTFTAKVVKDVKFRCLYKCIRCQVLFRVENTFKSHLSSCYSNEIMNCYYCNYVTQNKDDFCKHYLEHATSERYICGVCLYPGTSKTVTLPSVKKHMKNIHGLSNTQVCLNFMDNDRVEYMVQPVTSESNSRPKRKLSVTSAVTPEKKRYGPQDVDSLPTKPILDEEVFCTLCEYNTKVRHNMVRHLQLHAEQQPVPQTAPINPVPHLQTNEKHFDKMVNLASSSLVFRSAEKPKDGTSTHISPEAALSYPKYVEDRLRYVCGAKGCKYITVDEYTLCHHWDTLHSNESHFFCAHCPPSQKNVDTSKPLTSARMITHLKMHDVSLYTCSCCLTYYHYKLNLVEKHVAEKHQTGRVLIVREESTVTSSTSGQASGAPTMDLKPWHCGMCEFNNMLRQNVVDHCAKIHQSKMQYKCMYCPYRTSTADNITKHQASSHTDKIPEIFYFYYKEGTVPNEPDGTPRWIKQKQRNSEPPLKTEVEPVDPPTVQNIDPVAVTSVDLNIVKQEVVDSTSDVKLSVDELCEIYGQFCEPNGIKYKCPLCDDVTENCSETMQSHLFEELQYRKWGCNLCFYKAFHKKGLNDHMDMEHSRQRATPFELPTDVNIEKWVQSLLDHQTNIIKETKEKLALQKIQTERPKPPVNLNISNTIQAKTFNDNELMKAFGQFGTPKESKYRCPKCEYLYVNESDMQNHLENELSKIRWSCNTCSDHFQTYHEAQYHCKSVHTAHASRPVEAIRDAAMRTAWIVACITSQKRILATIQEESKSQKQIQAQITPETGDEEVEDSSENSLLVVRYEEPVTVPEVQACTEVKSQAQSDRKRPASDSDEDFLTIDENVDRPMLQTKKKKSPMYHCPHCDFSTKYAKANHEHIYRHYNLKPFMCHLCDYAGRRPNVVAHLLNRHGERLKNINKTPMPTGPPTNLLLTHTKKTKDKSEEELNFICLLCKKRFSEDDMGTHMHDNTAAEFAKVGEIVIKCSICLTLVKNTSALQEHNKLHPDVPPNYIYYKMHTWERDNHLCKYCYKRFSYIRDLRSHHEAFHKNQQLKYDRHVSATLSTNDVIDLDEDCSTLKRKNEGDLPPAKKVARKSTSKLPNEKSVAKKSTTKLPPLNFESESDDEYTHYGTKSNSLDEYSNITIVLPVLNKMVPMTIPKVSEILDVSPKVVLEDFSGPSD